MKRVSCTKCGSTSERPKDEREAEQWRAGIKEWVETHPCAPPDEPR